MYGLSEESLTIVGIILIVVGVAMIGWGFENIVRVAYDES